MKSYNFISNSEMIDYNRMKRKELQALCKEHNIPANSANYVLVEKLSKLLNEPEQEKPITRRRTCMKSPVETADESEPRQAKKVRFSPNNDLVEYELRSGKNQMAVATKSKARRKSVAMKVDKSVDDNNSIDDGVQAPSRRAVKGTNIDKVPEGNLGRVTRAKVHTLANGNAVQPDKNKQSKKSVKDVKKISESVEETVIGRVRVTRSKAQTSIDDGAGLDVNPQVKKKRGRQVAKDIENVEPSNELVDIPARVTRSRGQTSEEDINNVVSNPKPEKKRTRKEMKATDQSSMAPEDKQELPKRKSLRTRGAEEIDEDQGDKAEMVNVSRTTRSKAGLAVKSSGRNSESKTVSKNVVQQLEEPLKNAGRKNVKGRDVAAEDKELPKRKSSRTRGVENLEEDEGENVEVVNGGRATRSKAHLAVKASGRNGKTKVENKVVVQQLEEPLKHAGRKNVNSRKSVMPPENSKVVLHLDDPVNRPTRNTRGKSVVQKAQGRVITKAEIIGSPTAGEKQSKGKSAKVASDDEMKAANASGSPKSRKRRGTPVIEDQTIRTDYVAPVDESARRSTRSASKSEGKPVANKQLVSSVKTPTSRTRNQSVLKGAFFEGNQRGTSQTVRSGATIRGDSCNKRAKLSVPKQSDSEYHAVKFTEEGTPVSKLVKFESGKEGIETDSTPAIDGSSRRLTQSAIRSDKNEVGSILGEIDAREPTQRTNKKQLNEDVQLFSGKPGKFRPNPAVNTAPVRVTRSGVKHRGNASSNYSENVDKKKSARSVHKIQPLDDAQISSPKVAEVGPSPDVDSIGAQSEAPPAATDGILGSLGDIQTPFSLEVTETSSDAISEGPCVKNNVKSTLSEVEVQVAVNSEKSVPNETKSTEPLSVSKGLQTEVMVEESVVSIEKTVTMEEDNVDVFLGDADKKGDSSSYNIDSSSVYVESFEQSDVKGKLEEDEGHVEPSSIAGVDGGNEVEDNGESDGVEDDLDAAHDSLAEQSAGENISHGLSIDRCDVADVVVDAGTELAKELEADVVPSTRNDVHKSPIVSKSDDEHDSPILGIYDDEDISVDATKEHMLQDPVLSDGDGDGDYEGINNNNENESNSKRLTDDDASDTSLLGQDDGVNMIKQPEPTSEPSSANDVIETPFSDNDISVVDRESRLKPQTGSDASDIHLIGEYDVEGDTVDVPKELETGLEPSNAYNTLEVHVSGDDVDRENTVDDKSDGKYEYEQLTSNDNPATDEQYVGGVDLEPDHTEIMPAVTEDLITSSDREPEPESNIAIDKETCYTAGVCNSVRPSDTSTCIEASPAPATSGNDVASVTVDALEKSSLNINKDAISNIFGYKDELGSTIEVTYTKNDSGNEQIIVETSELNEGAWSKESASVSPHMGNELMTEEMKTTTVNDHTSTSDYGLDGGKFMDGCSNLGVDELDSQLENSTREERPSIVYSKECLLWGDLGAPKESSPSTYEKEEFSNSPASAKEGDNNKQGPNTPANLENSSFELDERKPVLADKSDVMDENVKEDRISYVATSARGSSFIEESTSSAAGFVDIVKNVDKASRNVTDGKSNQELDMMKENSNPDITNEIFNWSDSSLKSLFTTPPASPSNHVKDGQEDVVNFVNQDHYSSLKSLFTTPRTTITSHVKGGHEEAVNLTNQNHYSSLKSIPEKTDPLAVPVSSCTKPAPTTISHVKGSQEDAVNLDNQNYSSLKSLFTTPRTTTISHVKGREDDSVNLDNQNHYSSLKSLFTTPATTISHVEEGQEDAVNLADQNNYSSLKSLFSTPATTATSRIKGGEAHTTSHVKSSEADTTGFAFSDNSCNEDIGINQSAAPEFNHQWENEPLEVVNGETRGNTTNSPKNEIHGILSIEDYANKLFEDEVDGSVDGSGKNKNCEFNDDSYDLSGGASDSKDNMINSGMFEKEETQLKWTKNGDDLASD